MKSKQIWTSLVKKYLENKHKENSGEKLLDDLLACVETMDEDLLEKFTTNLLEEETTTRAKDEEGSPRLVHLTYFKPSGKYYGESSYFTSKEFSTSTYKVVEEVRKMVEHQALPGLRKSHSADFIVLITMPYNNLGTTALVMQGKFNE